MSFDGHPELPHTGDLTSSRLWPNNLCKSRLKHKPTASVSRWLQHTRFWLRNSCPFRGRQVLQTHAHRWRYRSCSRHLSCRSGASSFLSTNSRPEPSWIKGSFGHDLPVYCMLQRVHPLSVDIADCGQVFAELLLDGTQYIYFSEVWPNHLRAKGMTIAMATIALVNIMWLQVAPTAFA